LFRNLSPRVETLELRITPTVDVWTGASSNLWSDAGNWTLGAPTTGEDLDFPANASNKTSVYDSGLGVSSFGTITIDSGGYDISTSFSSSLTLTSGLSTTYGSSISNFDIGFNPGNGTVAVGAGGTLELGGVISGTSGLAFSGGGTLQLGGSSSNTYTGTTTVASATTLVLDKSGATAIPGALSISAGGTVQLAQSDQIANASLVTEGSGATLNLNNFDDTVGGLNLTGATVSTGTGTLTLGGNVTTNSDSNTSVISGNLDLGGATRSFTVANNAQLDPDLSITANISGTGAGLTKLGANSQLQLSGNNTYDGVTTISAGAIEIASNNALGASSAGTVVSSGFSLALLGGITVPEPITINGAGFGGLGAIFNGSGNNTISGAITLGAASTLGSLSGNLTFSGAISDGASSFALTKVGAGTVTLASANTYDGGTSITNGINGGGVLAISNGSALGTGSVSISNGNELDLSNNITLSRDISFQGTGVSGNGALRSVSGNNVYSGTATVQADSTEIQVDAGQLTLSGNLYDNANNYLTTKTGAGVLLVTGSLTSYGALRSVAGDVRMNGSYNSSVTLGGGNISGTGSISNLNQLGSATGTVDPGTGAGTIGELTTVGGYQIGTGGTTHIDIGGSEVGGVDYDQIANTTSGSVNITDSNLSVSLVNGYIPAIGNVFTIIDKQNSGAITGTFHNLAEGDTFKSGIVTYQVSYVGGTGNDVTLTVVGLTSTWTGLGGDNNWSTAANWDTNMTPTGGDLIFPDGAARLANTNDLSGMTFHSIEVDGGGYAISGNAVTMTNGLSSTYATGTSTFQLDTTLTATETVDVATGGTLVLSGALSGSGFGLTKTSGGTLELVGGSANTFSGTTTVIAGSLELGKTGNLAAFSGNLVVGDNVGTGASASLLGSDEIPITSSVTVNQGATFDLGIYVDTINTLTLRGASVTIEAGGILGITGGITSQIPTNDVTSTISGDGYVVIDSADGVELPITVAQDLNANVDLWISAPITGSNRGIDKLGSGTLALSNTSNNYTGNTNVDGGIIQVQANSALGNSDTVVIGTSSSVDFTGTSLDIGNNFSIGSGAGFNDGNALDVISGSTTLTGSITLAANSEFGATSSSTLTINGVIDDGASSYYIEIINGSTGRTVLGGSNLFDGAVYADSGYIQATNSNAFGDPSTSSTISFGTGGSLELAGGITIPSTKSFVLASVPVTTSSKVINVAGDNTIAGTISLINNNQSFDVASGTTLTVSGAISGSVDFDKNDTGTLILTGTNTNTGNVNVGDGTLLVNGSLASSNSIFVDGVLGGTGAVSAVTISSIGTLDPGVSIGQFSTGNLTFNSGSTYHVDLFGTTVGTQYDQTDVTGTVALNDATLNLQLGFTPSAGDVFTIISNDGTDPISGRFNGLTEGSTVTIYSQPFRISYVGGDGNDVTLTAIARTETWTGLGGDNNWSTAANWDTNVAPTGGEDLIFPTGAAQLSNNNDLTGMSFHSIEVDSGGYDINGNAVTLTNGIFANFASDTSEVHLNVALTANETVDVANGGDFILSGAISGSGFGVTKTGGGTLEYTGFSANTYTGTTTVDAGMLILNRASGLNAIAGNLVIGDNVSDGASVQVGSNNQIADGSSVTVNQGALFDLSSSTEAIGSLTLQGASVTIEAGGILTPTSLTTNVTTNHVTSTISGAGFLDLGGNSTFSMTIADDTAAVDVRISAPIQDGGFVKSGLGTLALSGSNTYAGNTIVSAGVLQVESAQALGVSGNSTGGYTSVNDSSSLVLDVPGLTLNEFIYLAGQGTGGLPGLWNEADGVTLNGEISLHYLTISQFVPLGTADGTTMTIAGSVSESTAGMVLIIGNGATGRVILAGDNTFTGGLIDTTGFLRATNANAFGDPTTSAGGFIEDGATLEFVGGITTPDTKYLYLDGAGVAGSAKLVNVSGNNIFGGAITLRADQTIDTEGGSLALPGVIDGEGYSLTKAGTGTLILSGINTYTGTTFVDEGLLQLNASGVSIPGNITVSGPGTAATVQELQGNQIADGSTVNLANAGATLDLNGFDDTIGSLSLTGSHVTTGAGTLTIHAAGGITTLASSQTASLSGNLAFDAANNYFTVDQGTTLSGVDFSVSAIVSSFANIIKAGAGTMAFSGANTYSGGTNINQGVLAISTSTGAGTGVVNILGTGTLDLSGGINVGNTLNLSSSGTAIRNSGGANVISGSVNLGSDSTIDTALASSLGISSTVDDSGNIWSLTKTGAGTLGLEGANTYLGGTTVSAGILAISNSGSLGTGNVVDNAEIEIVNNLLLNNNFTINSAGTAFLVDGLTTIQGTLTLDSDLLISTPGSANLYLNGVIASDGGGIVKGGTGTLGLGQANTYHGATTINGGYLQVFNGQATGTLGAVNLNSGATFILSTTSYTLPMGGLTLGDSTTFLVPLASIDTLSGSISLAGNATFSIATGGVLTVNDVISGTSGLTKSSGGALILNATSTYTGPTSVTGGLLEVEGDIFSSSGVTIGSSGALGGIGRVRQIIGTGGVLAPGDALGTLHSGSVSLNNASSFSTLIHGSTAGTGYSQLVSSGPINLGGATLGTSLANYVPLPGDVLTIIDNTGQAPITNTFAGLPEGTSLSINGYHFRISYVGGTGNDVTLTALGSTTTSLASNSATTTYGDQLVFTVLVTSSLGTPTGLVSFYDGSAIPANLMGTSAVNNQGIAVFTTTTMNASATPHSVIAVYAGASLFMGSTSSASAQTVNPATLTITANSFSRIYGVANPTFTATYSGFKNGETAANLTTQPSLSTVATSTSPLGSYAINAGGAVDSNYVISSVNGTLTINPVHEKLVPNDYNGDGKSDVAVYLPSLGAFAIRYSNGAPDQIIPFGIAGVGQSIPVSGDYDGDGKTDLAVYLPSMAILAYRPSSGGPDVYVSFGTPGVGQTIPVPGDYFGTGKTDVAAYLPALGIFALRNPNGGPDTYVSFGSAGLGQSIPVPGDFDGDGLADLAVYLPTFGEYAIMYSSGIPAQLIQFGTPGHGQSLPVSGDFDGDGKTDLAVYLPSIATEAYRPSSGGADVDSYFGLTGQGQTLPAPGDYAGTGHAEVAAYLPSQGVFAIRPGGAVADSVYPFAIPGTGQTIPVTLVDEALSTIGSNVGANAIVIPDMGPIANFIATPTLEFPKKKSS
jgi:autotransporter-associated beta strand protein